MEEHNMNRLTKLVVDTIAPNFHQETPDKHDDDDHSIS